jgi:hypothetical protein
MKTIVTAMTATAALVIGTAASFGAGSVDDFLKVAIVGTPTADARPAYLATPEPGYIVYTGYAAALPAPNCYWTRMPVYDFDHNVIGWRGRPTAVCP